MTTAYNFRLDGVSPHVAIKRPCRVTTTANITLSGLQTVDGIALAAGDRVLVKDQTDPIENGIYSADTSAWNRTKDFDGEFDAVTGTIVHIREGTSWGVTSWKLDTAEPVKFGTSSITFSQTTLSASDLSTSTVIATGSTTARTLADRHGIDTLSLFDFIPKAEHAAIQARTSTYDATADIQAAFDATKNTTGLIKEGVNRLVIPAGYYNITDELSLSSHYGVTIETAGSVRFLWTGATNPAKAMLRLTGVGFGTSGSSARMTVQGTIVFDADGKAGYALLVVGPSFGSLALFSNTIFQNATVQQIKLGSGTGDDISQMMFDRVQVAGTSKELVRIDSSNSYSVSFLRCTFTPQGIGAPATNCQNIVYIDAGHNITFDHGCDFGQMANTHADTSVIRTVSDMAARNCYSEESRFLIVDGIGGSQPQKHVVLDRIYSNDARDTLAGALCIRVDGSCYLNVRDVFLAGVGATVNNRHRTITVPQGVNGIIENSDFTNGSSTVSPLNCIGGTVYVNASLPIHIRSTAGTKMRFVPSTIGTPRFNWQIATQENVSNALEITPSTVTGGTTFSNPAFLVFDGLIGVATRGPVAPQNTAAKIYSGTGTPEGNVTADVGSLFLRTDAATSLYVKQTGTGNTGWVAK